MAWDEAKMKTVFMLSPTGRDANLAAWNVMVQRRSIVWLERGSPVTCKLELAMPPHILVGRLDADCFYDSLYCSRCPPSLCQAFVRNFGPPYVLVSVTERVFVLFERVPKLVFIVVFALLFKCRCRLGLVFGMVCLLQVCYARGGVCAVLARPSPMGHRKPRGRRRRP
jgi:hypothetical protein